MSAPLPEGDWLKFLGTAGTRFVIAKQTRASGGIWLSLSGVNILVDPGPGCLVRCWQSDPPLDPYTLDALVVTHGHLDHANDVNCIAEAMTRGGHDQRGKLLVPGAMIDDDSPLCDYILDYVAEVVRLQAGGSCELGPIVLSTPLRHEHTVETYGLVLEAEGHRLGIVVDTRYSDEVAARYAGLDLLVVNAVLTRDLGPHVYHLSLDEAERLIEIAQPGRAVLSHFGQRILEAGPARIAAEMSYRLGIEVLAAEDGMTIALGSEDST